MVFDKIKEIIKIAAEIRIGVLFSTNARLISLNIISRSLQFHELQLVFLLNLP